VGVKVRWIVHTLSILNNSDGVFGRRVGGVAKVLAQRTSTDASRTDIEHVPNL
jgi:hypothetical protein